MPLLNPSAFNTFPYSSTSSTFFPQQEPYGSLLRSRYHLSSSQMQLASLPHNLCYNDLNHPWHWSKLLSTNLCCLVFKKKIGFLGFHHFIFSEPL
jgi:hypothetical protein